jgi:hypothetical protein
MRAAARGRISRRFTRHAAACRSSPTPSTRTPAKPKPSCSVACADPGPHVRGCWAVDLMLGKN